MTSIVDEFRADEVRVLDRLVDGELTAGEERELLAALDDEPGAWRRCALAFLEARALQSDLNLARSAVLEVAPPAKAQTKSNIWGMLLASAASMLLAFTIGLKLRGYDWPWSVATNKPATRTGNEAPVTPLVEPGIETPQGPSHENLASATGPEGKWETFKLNLGEGSEEIDVPAVEMASVDPKWLENQGSAVPPDVIQYIQRTGHEVRRRRSLLPIDLKDGRQLIVPVEQLELEYVGGSKYQ